MSGIIDLEPLARLLRPPALSYCDYIAASIRDAMFVAMKECGLLREVGYVKSDLHPIGGYLRSTKKTLEVKDRNGREYKITVEDAE